MIRTIIANGTAENDYLAALKARQQETNKEVTRTVEDILSRVRAEGDAIGAGADGAAGRGALAGGGCRVLGAGLCADGSGREKSCNKRESNGLAHVMFLLSSRGKHGRQNLSSGQNMHKTINGTPSRFYRAPRRRRAASRCRL